MTPVPATSEQEISDLMNLIGLQAKAASAKLAKATPEQKTEALMNMARRIRQKAETILAANTKDMAAANEKGLSGPMLDRLMLDDARVDVALMSNVLHEASSPTRLVRDVARIVKKGGWIAIMEWKKEEMKSGPPLKERISLQDVEKLIEKLELPISARRLISGTRYLVLVEK